MNYLFCQNFIVANILKLFLTAFNYFLMEKVFVKEVQRALSAFIEILKLSSIFNMKSRIMKRLIEFCQIHWTEVNSNEITHHTCCFMQFSKFWSDEWTGKENLCENILKVFLSQYLVCLQRNICIARGTWSLFLTKSECLLGLTILYFVSDNWFKYHIF